MSRWARVVWLALLLAMLACGLPGQLLRAEPARTPAAPASPTASLPGAQQPTQSPFAPLAPAITPTLLGPLSGTLPPVPTFDYQPAFQPAACRFAVPARQDPQCGDLLVPENRRDPNTNLIRLHVAIFRGKASSPAREPVVYLSGGPGSSALDLAGYLFQIGVADVLAQRDLVLFDQRGTGRSLPRLDCPERQALAGEILANGLSAPQNEALIFDAFLRCRQRLEGQGIDLSAYTSAASAADVADLAQALSYPGLHLYAVSYGTRLALTVLRDQPGLVRSAVLDSAYPPQVNLYTELGANAERAFEAFFEQYAGSYPTLRSDFYALVERLNAQPEVLRIAKGGAEVQVRVDGHLLIDVLMVGLYNPAVTARMPEMIYAVRAGEFRLLRQRVDLFFDDSPALGMTMAVQCAEELAFVGPDEIDLQGGANTAVTQTYRAIAGSMMAGCAGWEAGAAGSPSQAPDPRENQPVSSDVPVLILAGSHDPITPPAWGQLAQASLPNGEYRLFEGHGHWVTRSSREAMQMALAFWER